jgi:hypothetical protein
MDSIESEMKQYDVGGVWFPEVVTYQRSVGGKIEREQVLTVDSAEFNVEADKKLFTLAGMNIPPATLVMGALDENGISQEWDGEKLVAVSTGATYEELSGKTAWFRVSLVMAALAFICLIAYAAMRR